MGPQFWRVAGYVHPWISFPEALCSLSAEGEVSIRSAVIMETCALGKESGLHAEVGITKRK